MKNIKAIVKFNEGFAIVLDKPIEKVYSRYGNTIIGIDNIFYSSLWKYNDPYAKAFAGRKFSIQLSDGEIVECNGDWWDGITVKTKEIIGEDLISITANDIESLKKCYVFNSHYASKKEYEALLQQYNGRIYGYWEYEALIKGTKPWKKDRVDFRKKKNHKRVDKIVYR